MARQRRRSSDGAGAGEPLSARVTVALEEYRALREEILASLAMQQTVLSFSTLALGALALAGFRDVNGELAAVIFLLVLPLVSYVSLFIWLGEYARTTRAGLFLMDVEERINGWIGARTLTWEQYLRTPVEGKRPQYAWNSEAIFWFYAVVPLLSVALALPVDDFGIPWIAVLAAELVGWITIVWFFLRGEFRVALAAAAGRAPVGRALGRRVGTRALRLGRGKTLPQPA